jgi:hypothetical protein
VDESDEIRDSNEAVGRPTHTKPGLAESGKSIANHSAIVDESGENRGS